MAEFLDFVLQTKFAYVNKLNLPSLARQIPMQDFAWSPAK